MIKVDILKISQISWYFHLKISWDTIMIYINDIYHWYFRANPVCHAVSLQHKNNTGLSDQIISKIHSVLQQKDDETFNSTLSTAGTDLHNTTYSVTRFYTRQKQSNTHTHIHTHCYQTLLPCWSASQSVSWPVVLRRYHCSSLDRVIPRIKCSTHECNVGHAIRFNF